MSKKYIYPKCCDCGKDIRPGQLRYEKDGKSTCIDCYKNDDPKCIVNIIEPIKNRWDILDIRKNG